MAAARRRRRLAGVAALALLCAAPGLPGGAAGAAEPVPADPGAEPSAGEAASGAPTFELTAQPAWVVPDGAALLELRVEGPAAGLEVAVTVHRAVTSRSALSRAFEGRGLGGVEGHADVPVESLPVDVDGHRHLVLGVQGPASTPDPGRIVPGRSGVYPLDVQLRDPDGETLTRFVTPLVVIAPGVVPLTLAWVWTLDATPARTPGGELGPEAERAVGPAGRLARMAAAAAEAADVPLTLAPVPETIEAWAEAAGDGDVPGPAAASLADLRFAATQPVRQVLGGPYVPVDPGALGEADLTSELGRQFERGTEALADVLGVRPAGDSVLAGPIDTAGAVRLRRYGVERLVLPPDELVPVEHRLTPGRPFALGARGRLFSAAVADPDLAGLLGGADPPALRAARFLAAVELVALEAPRETRGVVVVTPPGWDPPRPLLDAVLVGLRGNPAVQPATLDSFFADVPPEVRGGRPLVRSLAGGDSEALAADPDRIRSLRRRLRSFTEVVGEGQPAARHADRAVLTSQAAALAPAGGDGDTAAGAYLDGAAGFVRGVTGRVQGPDGQRVTLTARRGTIPISLLNANRHPLSVRIRLESDRLRFPGGAERLLTLPPQNTTVSFTVEARAPGSFPLVITVTSPDGALLVNRSELTIRSTVVSGVGALLTTGAGFFLLVWWGNDLRRTRRRRGRPGGGGAREAPEEAVPAEAPVPG